MIKHSIADITDAPIPPLVKNINYNHICINIDKYYLIYV
jgi:hypothetical protein